MAIDSQHEIQAGRLSRDTRSAWTRFMVSLHRPNNFKLAMLALIGLMIYQPAAWPVWILIMCMMVCLLYTSPSPRDKRQSRMPSSA